MSTKGTWELIAAPGVCLGLTTYFGHTQSNSVPAVRKEELYKDLS